MLYRQGYQTGLLAQHAANAFKEGYACRHMSALPYRIRAPLAKLREKKKEPVQAAKESGLGDGEKLESNAASPDYVRLAMTSRVYDFISETPLQLAQGLSQRLQVYMYSC